MTSNSYKFLLRMLRLLRMLSIPIYTQRKFSLKIYPESCK